MGVTAAMKNQRALLRPSAFGLNFIGPQTMKANSSYAFARRVAQSSGIDLCLKANFTGPNDTNLIVAKGSLLQVFRLHEPQEVRIPI